MAEFIWVHLGSLHPLQLRASRSFVSVPIDLHSIGDIEASLSAPRWTKDELSRVVADRVGPVGCL
jgi:hypothetical protein